MYILYNIHTHTYIYSFNYFILGINILTFFKFSDVNIFYLDFYWVSRKHWTRNEFKINSYIFPCVTMCFF